MSVIEDILDKTTISFVSKKAQMYTLFCVVFKMFDDGKSFDNFLKKSKYLSQHIVCLEMSLHWIMKMI